MKYALLIFFFCYGLSSYGVEESRFPNSCSYKVQKNDSLKQIYNNFTFPRSSKRLFYLKTRSMNPKVKNFDKIFPGQILTLPVHPSYSVTQNLWSDCRALEFSLPASRKWPPRRKPAENSPYSTQPKPPARTQISLGVGSLFESIHSRSQQPHTVLVSDLQPTLLLEIKNRISKSWNSLIRGSLSFKSYLRTNGGQVQFEEQKFTSTKIDFGFQFFWDNFSSIDFTLGFGDFAYYHASQINIYELQINKVPRIHILFSQSLLSGKRFGVSGLFGLGYFGNAEKNSAKFTGGLDHGLGLRSQFIFNTNHQIILEGYYNQGQFKTDLGGFEKRWLQTNLHYQMGF